MRRDGAVDPVVTSLLVLTLDPVVIPLRVLILVWVWPGAKPDAPGRPLMASLFFFRWPGAYAEAPFDTLPLFDTLTLLCIICPGAVGCCAMAGALTNAAKVPITARYLIIGGSFLCAPSTTPAESQGFPPSALQGTCLDGADSVPMRWSSVPARVPESSNEQTSRNQLTYFGSMPRQNKDLRPKLDLEAEALAALEEARTTPPGPERNEAMKQAGILRNAADLQGVFFAKRGRPAKP
jgi:hypothetical protein